MPSSTTITYSGLETISSGVIPQFFGFTTYVMPDLKFMNSYAFSGSNDSNMNTTIKTINQTDNYYTGVLNGPFKLDFYNSSQYVQNYGGYQYKRYIMGIRASFNFDIYLGKSYVKQNQYTINAVVGNYQYKGGENLQVINIKDGFLKKIFGG